MYYNVNDPIRNNVNPSKNSQKNKNIFQPNLKVFQSPSQQNQNLVYSNNNDYKNYSIKVNKAKNQPKEKVIEGDLNFNNKNVHHNRITNNQKPKKNRGKPTKSPVPLPKDYKLANYQKLFSNHHLIQKNLQNLLQSLHHLYLHFHFLYYQIYYLLYLYYESQFH